MTVLLTRPRADSERIARALPDVATAIWPLTEIVPVATDLAMPEEAQAVVFTSANAVDSYAALGGRRDLPAICVGARTASSARAVGFTDVATGPGTAAGLVDLIAGRSLRRVFYPRGREVSTDLAGALAARGIETAETVVYAAEPGGPPESALVAGLSDGGVGLVTVWSRRSAALLASHIAGGAIALHPTCDLLAISEGAAGPLLDAGFCNVIKAEAPDAPAMIAAIRAHAAALRQ